MDENTLTTDTREFPNNHSESSLWEMLENAVNGTENPDASITSDRHYFQYHSGDQSDFLTREPRFSSTVPIFNNTNSYQLFNEPQDQIESFITESFGIDHSVATFESNDRVATIDQTRRGQEFSNFAGDRNLLISNTSTGKLTEVTLSSNLQLRQHQLEKTMGGSQVDHYPIQQPSDDMGAELSEEELLMLLNEAASSAINSSGFSTNYQLPVASAIHHEVVQVLFNFSLNRIQSYKRTLALYIVFFPCFL